MRYLVQFVIPALIFVSVVYLLTRGRRHQSARQGHTDHRHSDTAAFLGILGVSAVVALGTAYALVVLWD